MVRSAEGQPGLPLPSSLPPSFPPLLRPCPMLLMPLPFLPLPARVMRQRAPLSPRPSRPSPPPPPPPLFVAGAQPLTYRRRVPPLF